MESNTSNTSEFNNVKINVEFNIQDSKELISGESLNIIVGKIAKAISELNGLEVDLGNKVGNTDYATFEKAGIVKIGGGLNVSDNGTLNVNSTGIKTIVVNINASDWTDNVYTIICNLITDSNYVSICPSHNISIEQYNALGVAKIICVGQSNGEITLKALGTQPSIDIPVILTIESGQIDVINESVKLNDDTTGITYALGIDNGKLYIE